MGKAGKKAKGLERKAVEVEASTEGKKKRKLQTSPSKLKMKKMNRSETSNEPKDVKQEAVEMKPSISTAAECTEAIRCLRYSLSSKYTCERHLFLKANGGNSHSLLIGNVPCYLDLNVVKGFLAQFVRIPIVDIVPQRSNAPGNRFDAGQLTVSVEFASAEGVNTALLEAEKVGPYVAEEFGTFDTTTCLDRAIKSYAKSLIPKEELKEKVESLMEEYDQKRAEDERLMRKRRMVADDDGWITVTKSARKGVPAAKKVKQGEVGPTGKLGQKKKAKIGDDVAFYNFQIKESRLKHITELRAKFDQDKKRVALAKAARKRPKALVDGDYLKRIYYGPVAAESAATGQSCTTSWSEVPIGKRPNMSENVDRDLFRVPNETPVVGLSCQTAFDNLTPKERLYAHYIARAAFEGGLAIFLQVSPESAGIFCTLYRLFSSEDPDQLKKKAISQAGFSENEWTNFLVWAATFYYNSGNYKGFGDCKIVPDVDQSKLTTLMESSVAAARPDFLSTYKAVADFIFSLTSRSTHLGFPDQGVTTYHSELVKKSDSDLINEYMKSKNMEGWNTRLFKDADNTLRIKFASASVSISEDSFNGARIVLEKGDYSHLMERTAISLAKASEYAANDNQKAMLLKYAEHFTSGELVAHKDGSRLWIKDMNPVVENYIGFIENYRDPAGIRSEFEGFVAAVNKETSKKFSVLVEKAEKIIERLPWGRAYEKDKFLRPDFTALDILAFACSGLPAGINIPNYDDIRQNVGFKNVSLSNVISAMPKQKMNFVSEEDENLIFTYNGQAFEVQVGLHELLGHGSGKLFQKNEDGTFNFDKEHTVDILTGTQVKSWYEPGETWGGKFGQLASAYEECRAEAVGYVLCCDHDILKIFGHEGEAAETIKYVNWLSEIRAGLLALEFYSAEQKKWGQAHCWARFVLTKVCLEAGQGFVTIQETVDKDGKPDLIFKLDRTKIFTVGRTAVNEFLKKLQAYKSTGDFNGGKALFDRYGSVSDEELRWRDICIAKRKPRRIFVQPNTKLTDEGKNAQLVTYPETAEGIIQSFLQRYDIDAVNDLEKLWKEDHKYFPSAFNIKN